MVAEERKRTPLVTGLSPKEGTPGTLVTIRGERLGHNQQDLLAIQVCGQECLYSVRWESSHKIQVRCPAFPRQHHGPTTGDVIVVTKSGGVGECTLQFKLNNVQTGPLQESVMYVDETKTVLPRLFSPTTPAAVSAIDDDPLGICSEQGGSSEVKLNEMFPDDLHIELKRDTSKTGTATSWTEALTDSIKESQEQGTKLFADVLGRKEQADSTRNALSILQRFKFLFFLPNSIDRSLEKGHFALILSEYTRAQSLFGESEVPLFKEAFVEVEKKMVAVKQMLMEKILEFPTPLEEQKKLIRYLLALETREDPAWSCLGAYYRWLKRQVWEMQTKHKKIEKQEKLAAEQDFDNDSISGRGIPQRFQFSEAIFSLICKEFPQFWKLSQSYLSGILTDDRFHNHVEKEEELESMVFELFRLAVWTVLNAVLPDALPFEAMKAHKERFVEWIVDELKDDTLNLLGLVKSSRICLSSLHQQEFAARHLKPLYELNVTLRLRCLNRLLEQTIDNIHCLDGKETWKVQASGADYAKTQLPDLFENIISEVLPLIRQVTAHSACPGEPNLFATERLKDALLQSFEHLLLSFKETLESLARLSSQSSTPGVRPRRLSFNVANGVELGRDGALPGIKDKKLLIVLANADYCHKYSLRTLLERLNGAGVSHIRDIMKNVSEQYASLVTVLEHAYIGAKCSTFTELLETSSANSSSSVKDVSEFIRDLILCMIGIKAELYMTTPHLLSRILPLAVFGCIERILLHLTSRELSENFQKKQAMLDICGVEVAFKSYTSDEARAMLDKLKSKLGIPQDLIEENLQKFLRSSKLMIESLNALPFQEMNGFHLEGQETV